MIGVYILAHEGTSNGSVSGLGRVAKHWSRELIEELAEAIEDKSVPVKISHQGRNTIGHTIGCQSVIQNDITMAIVKIRFDEHKNLNFKNLDAISGEIDLAVDTRDWTVLEIIKVTGIAVENRKTAIPGFKHARVLEFIEEE